MKNLKPENHSDDEESEEEVETKELLEPLDEESSSDEETKEEAKTVPLKLDNKVPKKEKKKKENDSKEEKTEEEKPSKPKTDPNCTIFVGNIPTNTKLKALKQHYSRFGEIQSLRFRSENGKKVLNKTDRKKYTSLNAYIVFKTPESAREATSTNGEVFRDNHLRCNLVASKQEQFSQKLNTKSTVFVGNITFEANDEELYAFFAEKCGPIEYVRRIPKKGFAYVCFKAGVPLVRAMKLNGEPFQGRPLRVQKWESKEQMAKKEKRLQKKLNGKALKAGKVTGNAGKSNKLNTTRPSKNPLLMKIKEKTKTDDTISKAEHKQKYKKGNQEDREKKIEERKKKKAEYLGVRTDRAKKAKALKKKQTKDKKLKKIVKVLTAPGKKEKQ
ncbi:uncharacterized protein LOC134834422 [Culicoides brevitarsis]|uniref:uncharacterized protein LOC134834422 n=1 Tax=Culicoides brevitarsis TaxID=469753 RepID=UPI00307CAC38